MGSFILVSGGAQRRNFTFSSLFFGFVILYRGVRKEPTVGFGLEKGEEEVGLMQTRGPPLSRSLSSFDFM